MDNATIDGLSRRKEDRRKTNRSCDFERRVRVRRFLDLYLNAADPKRNELKSIHLADHLQRLQAGGKIPDRFPDGPSLKSRLL